MRRDEVLPLARPEVADRSLIGLVEAGDRWAVDDQAELRREAATGEAEGFAYDHWSDAPGLTA